MDREDVVITGIDVDVDRRSRTVPGTEVEMGQQCGSGLTARFYEIDLDAGKPAVRLIGDDRKLVGFPYKVSAGDPEMFILEGRTTGYARWTARMHWVSGGKRGETVIDNKGRPFTSFWRDADYWYDVQGRRLYHAQ
jgi:hypothetical protein